MQARLDNRSKNKEWDSFDRAVGIEERESFIAYALEQSGNEEFRQLLAPEIMYAFFATASMYCVPIINLKQYYDDHKDFLLPLGMCDQLEKRLLDVLKAQMQVDSEKKCYLDDLILFFEKDECEIKYKKSYAVLEGIIKEIFFPSDAIVDPLFSSKIVYRRYIEEYYEKGNFRFRMQLFIPGAGLVSKTYTSMIDIAARFLKTQIIIQEEKNGKLHSVYCTEARPEYQGNTKTLQCSGFNNFKASEKLSICSTVDVLRCILDEKEEEEGMVNFNRINEETPLLAKNLVQSNATALKIKTYGALSEGLALDSAGVSSKIYAHTKAATAAEVSGYLSCHRPAVFR